MSRIQCRFAQKVLVPRDAFDVKSLDDLETLDGVHCSGRLLTTWNNADDYWEEELYELCNNMWGTGFDRIQFIYRQRMGRFGNIWDLIELTKIDN